MIRLGRKFLYPLVDLTRTPNYVFLKRSRTAVIIQMPEFGLRERERDRSSGSARQD